MLLLPLAVGIVMTPLFVVTKEESSPDDPKIWSTCGNSSCSCGKNTSFLLCSHDTLQFQPCYCIYYDQTDNTTVTGSCMLTCYNTNRGLGSNFYLSIDRYSVRNATLFNQEMCTMSLSGVVTHREGRFCGACVEGYGLAVYSYHYTSCVPCTNYGYKNWMRYFAVSLLPLTLFYFLVVLLQINLTSSRLNGIVFVIQCMLSPLQLRIIDGWINATNGGGTNIHKSLKLTSVLVALLGVFNLDFFRDLYPYFCLHPKFNILHVASLDFIVALYPFALIFLTYLLVSMYDRNYRPLVLAWKPFKWCLRCYQRQFNVKASLVHTFATFILLSNVKILGVCFDLLVPTRAYDEAGNELGRHFLYYDATIEYFGPKHLPFAVLALLIGFLFVFLPFLLLVVYPCGCFQRCLDRLGLGCPALHIFMDAFQGSYRTEPRDLRYFSAYYLLLRYLLLQVAVAIESLFYIPVVLFLVLVSTLILSLFQPYRSSSHNRLDMVAMLVMAMIYSGFASNVISSFLDKKWLRSSQWLLTLSLVLFAVIVTISVFWTCGHNLYYLLAKLLKCMVKKVKREPIEPHYIETLDRQERREPDAWSPLIN